MSLVDHPISQPSLDISPTWTPVITAEVKNYNSVQCRLSGKISIFCVVTIRRICIFSDDTYSDSSVMLSLIRVNFFLILVLTLADGLCCAWFIYPTLCWSWCPEIGTSSIDWTQLSSFHPRMERKSSLRKVICFK
jgi:hypothetical protein